VSEGNPNHLGAGPGGGQFTSAPGRHLERNRRKRAKKKALRDIHRAGHAEAKGIKREHKGHWANLKGEQRSQFKQLRREQSKERAAFRKSATKSMASLRATHEAEKRTSLESHKEAIREEMVAGKGYGDFEQHKQTVRDEGKARIKADFIEARASSRKAILVERSKQKRAWLAMKVEHSKARLAQQAEFKDYRQGIREDHTQERTLFMDDIRAQLAKAGLTKRKVKASK
jgi:hypothetical protein